MHPVHSFFFATIHRPPSSTLFPYTTLFRSWLPQSKYLEPHARHRSQQIAFLVTGGSRRSREPPASSELQVQPCIRSEEHTSELQSHSDLVCRLLLEKKISETLHIANVSITR